MGYKYPCVYMYINIYIHIHIHIHIYAYIFCQYIIFGSIIPIIVYRLESSSPTVVFETAHIRNGYSHMKHVWSLENVEPLIWDGSENAIQIIIGCPIIWYFFKFHWVPVLGGSRGSLKQLETWGRKILKPNRTVS